MKLIAPVTDYISKAMLTTIGDMVIRGATGPERLPRGVDNYVLTMNQATLKPEWHVIRHALETLLTTKGDTIYHTGAMVGRLVIGDEKDIITQSGGIPQWVPRWWIWDDMLATQGDIAVRKAATTEALPIGGAYQFLRVSAGGSDLFYDTVDSILQAVLTDVGDIIVRGVTVATKLPMGAARMVLGVNDAGAGLLYRDGIEIANVQGDIIKRGAAAAEKMSIGAAKEVLTVNDAGDDLEYKAPTGNLFNTEYSAANAGLITVTGAPTTIITLDIGTLTLGARILITISIQGSKGGTAGDVHFKTLRNTGTGSITFAHNLSDTHHAQYLIANEDWYITTSFVGKIIQAGTLTLELTGVSGGSDFTIAISEGQIHALVLKE